MCRSQPLDTMKTNVVPICGVSAAWIAQPDDEITFHNYSTSNSTQYGIRNTDHVLRIPYLLRLLISRAAWCVGGGTSARWP